jgi:hypothetical protein
MRLTELHSSRIEAIITDALSEHLREHECECEDCQCAAEVYAAAKEDGEDPEGDAPVTLLQEISVKQVTQKILLALKKLEAELVPA